MSEVKQLSGLHLLLALGIPFVLLLLMGCMKATAQKEDLGPEIPTAVINAALAKVEGSANLNSLAIGQYLLYSYTRRIENGDDAVLLGGRKVDVLDRQDTSTQARFTVRIENSVRQVDGSFETTYSEDPLWLTKTASTTSLPPILSPQIDQWISAQSTVSTTTTTQPQRITYHHLSESDAVIPAPAAVQGRAGCGGIASCQLPVHYIQFEQVTWQDDSDYTKISFDFAFSPATPMIPFGQDFDQLSGLMIENCQSTYVPVDTRTVYVRDCLELDDFQK